MQDGECVWMVEEEEEAKQPGRAPTTASCLFQSHPEETLACVWQSPDGDTGLGPRVDAGIKRP